MRNLYFFGLLLVSPLVVHPEQVRDQRAICHMGNWNDAKWDYLTRLAAEKQPQLLESSSTFFYPFSLPVRRALERRDEATIPLLAYGSLMNPQSASKTLDPATVASGRPVIAFGLKRLFNYDVPSSKSQDTPTSILDQAMLNTELSHSTKDIINGVVMEVQRDELLALCRREVGYDLVPVLVVDWEEALCDQGSRAPRFSVAYVLRAPNEPRLGRAYTRGDITPSRKYYALVRESAAIYGPQFLALYLNTTYLADGKTTLCQWEANNRSLPG